MVASGPMILPTVEQAHALQGHVQELTPEEELSLTDENGDSHETEYTESGDPVLSPSQRETYRGCPRQWGLKYLEKRPDPPRASAVIGKRMHRQLEFYYAKGRIPDQDNQAGICATKLLPLLPLPGPKRFSERRFKFEYEGVTWRGAKDLTDEEPLIVEITDFKSTSDLKWAKSAEMLATDTQAVTYALEEMLRRQVSEVDEKWAYVTRTKSPQTRIVPYRATWAGVQSALPEIYVDARTMLRLYREKPAANSLEPRGIVNGRCESLCRYAGSYCHVTAMDRMRAQLAFQVKREDPNNMVDFLASITARAAKAAQSREEVAPATSAPPPLPAPGTAATGSQVRDVLLQHIAAVAAETGASVAGVTVGGSLNPEPFTPPEKSEPPAPTQAGEPAPKAPGAPVATRARGAATRGRAGVEARALATREVPGDLAADTTIRIKDNTLVNLPVDESMTGVHSQAEIAQAVTDYCKANTEGVSIKAAGVEVASVVEPRAAAREGTLPEGMTVKITGKSLAAALSASPGFRLFINCSPEGESAVLFSRYVQQVIDHIKGTTGASAYQLIDFKGTGLFQSYLQQMLETAPPQGNLLVDTGTAEGRDAVPTLVRYCTGAPVRGWR